MHPNREVPPGRIGVTFADEPIFATLVALIGRLIPADELGAGAIEARVDNYIANSLDDALSSDLAEYRRALIGLNSYAVEVHGKTFASLGPTEQDLVVADLAAGRITDAETFFPLVMNHTIEGFLGDPVYGGNANLIGWRLINYPGPRLATSPAQQRINASVPIQQSSAYELRPFRAAGL